MGNLTFKSLSTILSRTVRNQTRVSADILNTRPSKSMKSNSYNSLPFFFFFFIPDNFEETGKPISSVTPVFINGAHHHVPADFISPLEFDQKYPVVKTTLAAVPERVRSCRHDRKL